MKQLVEYRADSDDFSTRRRRNIAMAFACISIILPLFLVLGIITVLCLNLTESGTAIARNVLVTLFWLLPLSGLLCGCIGVVCHHRNVLSYFGVLLNIAIAVGVFCLARSFTGLSH